MTRPLRYDDSFTNIINEKIHDKFLHILNIKVQSTAFNQKLNLQRSLLITSLWDIMIGIIFTFIFFEHIHDVQNNVFFFLQNFILMVGIFFGFVGLDASTNLRKVNTKIYKNWRIFVTLTFPLFELINNFSFFCNYWNFCSKLQNLCITIFYFTINMYFTKIAWSFFIRLEKGHEILIIHGKYLEKMINEENYKLGDVKKYLPPENLLNKTTKSEVANNSHSVDNEMSIFTGKANIK